MSTIESQSLRAAYERSRVRSALWGAAPLLALPALCCGMGTPVLSAAIVAALLFAFAAFAMWRGQSVARALAPGLAAGLLPLGLAYAAKAYGHVCMGASCVSLCVPACAAGGVLAGLWVAYAGRKVASPLLFAASGGGAALLVGSLGCSCVGFGGVLGLAAGLLVPLGAGLLRAKWQQMSV